MALAGHDDGGLVRVVDRKRVGRGFIDRVVVGAEQVVLVVLLVSCGGPSRDGHAGRGSRSDTSGMGSGRAVRSHGMGRRSGRSGPGPGLQRVCLERRRKSSSSLPLSNRGRDINRRRPTRHHHRRLRHGPSSSSVETAARGRGRRGARPRLVLCSGEGGGRGPRRGPRDASGIARGAAAPLSPPGFTSSAAKAGPPRRIRRSSGPIRDGRRIGRGVVGRLGTRTSRGRNRRTCRLSDQPYAASTARSIAVCRSRNRRISGDLSFGSWNRLYVFVSPLFDSIISWARYS